MKILHVYKFYAPIRGGGITAMQSVIEGLSDSVESRVLSATAGGIGYRDNQAGVAVRRVTSLGYVYSMPIAPTMPLWFIHDARAADIIHIHLPFPLADLALAICRPRAPIVLHWHSDIVQQKRIKALLGPFIRHTLRRAARIIVASPRHVECSGDLVPFQEKCSVIPYGIDIREWENIGDGLGAEVRELRQRFPRMVFFLGRLVAYKGLENLIRAMADVPASLVIAGAGPLEMRLRQQVRDYGIADRTHFLGEVSQARLKALYHASSMVVLPSIWENEAFGLSQLEGMVCGKPIINTTLPTGVPWVARHNKEALTVAPGDAAALAEAIRHLFDHPEDARRLGEAGRHRVGEVFDLEKTNRQIYGLYQELVQESGRDRAVVTST